MPPTPACSGLTPTAPAANASGLSFQGSQRLVLRASESAALQLSRGPLTLSSWVYLPESVSGELESIQTVIASKESGCEANEAHRGVALFINAWNTNSRQLFLSWGNGA